MFLSEVFINLVSVAYLKRTYLKVWSCTEHITSSVVISVYFVTRFAIIGTDQFMELLVYSNIQVWNEELQSLQHKRKAFNPKLERK